MMARAGPLYVNHAARVGDPATHPPPTTASSSSTRPMSEASSTFPGRHHRMYAPMSMAMGMVAAMVNVPHGLSAKARTTTRPMTASKITMMMNTPSMAV